MTLRRRTYPEVLERLLVAVSGGVAGEQHPYPPDGGPPYVHLLERPPVSRVTSVHGSRDGEPHRFREETDWVLDADSRSLRWLEDGALLPDDGTLVSVCYLPEDAAAELTDLEVGSVLRTLLETVSLELASVSAQVESALDAGFVDTATGRSLDRVVALLGVDRITAGRAAGDVEFRRAPDTVGLVNIPAGTRLTTADGSVAYEIVEEATLLPTQQVVRVPARDLEDANEPLEADSLVVLPAPIQGIAAVTNPAPTTRASRDEDDAALRARAKRFLHGSERATLGALRTAVASQGVLADVEEDPATPGYVDVTPHASAMTPELRQRVVTALRDARPAGVVVRLHDAQAPHRVNVTIRLQSAQSLLATDRRAIQRRVRGELEEHFAQLPTGSDASLGRIIALVGGVDGVVDVHVVAATLTDPATGAATVVLDTAAGVLAIAGSPTVLGDLHLADPDLPTRIGVVVTLGATDDPVDVPAVEQSIDALAAALNDANADVAVAGPASSLAFEQVRPLLPLPDQTPAAANALLDGSVAPDAGDASAYRVRFVLTQESGLATVLASAGDTYTLTPFERLTRDAVDAVEEPAGG